jgi:hypothetical protein
VRALARWDVAEGRLAALLTLGSGERVAAAEALARRCAAAPEGAPDAAVSALGDALLDAQGGERRVIASALLTAGERGADALIEALDRAPDALAGPGRRGGVGARVLAGAGRMNRQDAGRRAVVAAPRRRAPASPL